MTKATFIYLNHRIEIELPNPEEDNTILCTIYQLPGTYDSTLYSGFVDNFQFSACNEDPNLWVLEAVNQAVLQVSFSGVEYYTAPPVPAPVWAEYGSDPDTFTEF